MSAEASGTSSTGTEDISTSSFLAGGGGVLGFAAGLQRFTASRAPSDSTRLRDSSNAMSALDSTAARARGTTRHRHPEECCRRVIRPYHHIADSGVCDAVRVDDDGFWRRRGCCRRGRCAEAATRKTLSHTVIATIAIRAVRMLNPRRESPARRYRRPEVACARDSAHPDVDRTDPHRVPDIIVTATR